MNNLIFLINGNIRNLFKDMIKNRIDHCEELAPDFTRLIFQGKNLDDVQSCADYGIEDGSTVHLVIMIRGGVRVLYS